MNTDPLTPVVFPVTAVPKERITVTKFPVQFLHNVTVNDDGRLAVIDRYGDPQRHRPTDTYRQVAYLLVEAASAREAAEAAFGISNGYPHGDANHAAAREYTDKQIRSMVPGDVISVTTPDGPLTLAALPIGWTDIDLDELRVVD